MDKICGAYAEHWEELGKPKGWLGCSLPEGHSGDHGMELFKSCECRKSSVPAEEDTK